MVQAYLDLFKYTQKLKSDAPIEKAAMNAVVSKLDGKNPVKIPDNANQVYKLNSILHR